MGAEGELYYSFRVAFAISVSTMRFLEWQTLVIIILGVAAGEGTHTCPRTGRASCIFSGEGMAGEG